MGLKTTNYEIKEFGITIPQAYAIIKNLYIKGGYARADFVVQADRTATSNKEPLQTVKIEFTLDRNESPFITAYKYAKGQHYEVVRNEETEKYEKVLVNNSVFYGGEDDIVEE